jgi:hypothetical protein
MMRYEALEEIALERKRQDAKFGEQNQPDGTGEQFRHFADQARLACDIAKRLGSLTWKHVLAEEFFEALAESDPKKLTTELLQVAAVCVAWVEAIGRREEPDRKPPVGLVTMTSDTVCVRLDCERFGYPLNADGKCDGAMVEPEIGPGEVVA